MGRARWPAPQLVRLVCYTHHRDIAERATVGNVGGPHVDVECEGRSAGTRTNQERTADLPDHVAICKTRRAFQVDGIPVLRSVSAAVEADEAPRRVVGTRHLPDDADQDLLVGRRRCYRDRARRTVKSTQTLPMLT